MRYRRDTVVLTLSLPVERAKMVLNRLWGCGCLSEKQYRQKMERVVEKESESLDRRNKRLEVLFGETKGFYETEKK